jgi:phage anti-repressor protein
MNPIIKIEQDTIGGEQVQTVDARRLHKFLSVGRNFSNWIKGRIAEYGFVEGADYVTAQNLSTPNPARSNSRAQRTIEYHLTLDMAKELSMVERTDKGREARRYFIECERIALGKIAKPEDDNELSTVRDRRPLYHGAVDIVVTYRLSFGKAYQALNWYAGSDGFPRMTKRQAAEAAGFVRRLLTGEATQKDFQRINQNQAAIAGVSPQMQLGLTIPLLFGGEHD